MLLMSLGKEDASFCVLVETITCTKYILILVDCHNVLNLIYHVGKTNFRLVSSYI